MITVDKIENTADFAALRGEWDELLKAGAANNLFLTWEWLFTWWKHLAEDRRLEIVTVRRDRQLIAIAPLAVRPSRLRRLVPFSVLEFLGSGSVGSDYLDILVRSGAEQDALAQLAGWLAGHKLMLELSQVRRSAPCTIDLALALAQHGWISSCRTTDSCPYIEFSGQSWESYLEGLGRAHRYNLRRRLRNVHKQFAVRFEQVHDEERRREALRLLVELHHKRWSERSGTDAFHTPALLAFHEELTRLTLLRGWLRLCILWLDGKPAAALYGFKYNGVFYFYQSGFDPEFKKHSVGLVVMGLAIKSAIEEGAQVYDFLHGGEPYKFLWAREKRELMRVELYPPSARGRLYRQAMKFRGGIKKWLAATAPADPAVHAVQVRADEPGGDRHVA